MTLHEFNLLKEKEKTALLCTHGDYAGERKVEYYNILLYRLGNFCVELFYNENDDEIAHLHSFEDGDKVASLYYMPSSLN